ncbi:catalase [Streptomyces sp. NBC_00237]|uniref:catalase n=1 Tax=Streptomyces sp. NBC_00237 TaxID=2975687 RepID=UPI0022520223|nr:catalase [Streptomyces sp. NBC_00237]MCX5205517.1 catalase [Streptomyces sp. NBC_00237]
MTSTFLASASVDSASLASTSLASASSASPSLAGGAHVAGPDGTGHDGTGHTGAALVEQVAGATGADPGDRLLHARGAWAVGGFTPSARAAELSTAALFIEPATAATARFSSTLGGPGGHDGDPGDHGLAVRIGGLDLVMFTLPVFFVRTGAHMVEFLRATNSPDPDAVPAFLARRPEAATALGLAQQSRPAAGFTALAYHSVHAFGLTDAAGTVRWARLSWRPLRPVDPLSPEDASARPGDYLSRGLPGELPARFDLVAHLPGDGDEVHDPTRLWASDRTVPLGTLTLDRAGTPSVEPDFDPLRLPEGVAAPRDRLAADRSRVYRAARARRA